MYDFWSTLEYRACDELRRLPPAARRGLWCDGFIPESAVLRGPGRHVAGVAWIDQQRWSFRLFVGDHVHDRDAIPWARLLPRPGSVGWLEVDTEARHLTIDPRAARRTEPARAATLEFRAIDLDRHASLCVAFRRESFVTSFGDESRFVEQCGADGARYLAWLRRRIIEHPDGHVHVWRDGALVGQVEMRVDGEPPRPALL